jgi:hypothetical protein
LGSLSIALGNVYWDKTSASLGETVSFHVGFSNPYRATQTNGTLRVDVMNDWGYGKETLYQTYTHSVSLNAAKSEEYREPCTLPTTDWDQWATIYRGWFLKVYWSGTLIYTMGLDSPPELRHS